MSERPTIRHIAALVAEKHGITVEELRGPSAVRRLAWPRHEAFALIHGLGVYSLNQIGGYFGGRDHTTVRTGVMAHNARQRGERLSRAA